ncbi:Ankyrin repeat domain-containing protein 54 [Trichoplax sp. H2]|nr:Ankyrin repeat domain-containing protein 54 [Trichoplax sp. H2]|eukprot:RDD39102.1 Ankyrin repeat domain-containing protein 54 [Trichoplax sp. H2]
MDELASGEDMAYEVLTKIQVHDRYYKRKYKVTSRSKIPRPYKSIDMERRLIRAATEGNIQLVCQLIHRGVNVRAADDKRRTALHVAANLGHNGIVKVLIENGADVHQRDCNGNTPLHLAACSSNIEVLTTLMGAGTSVDATDFNGITPLHLALSHLRILDEDESCSCDITGLKAKLTEVVKLLKHYLKSSKNVDATDKDIDDLEMLTNRISISTTAKEVSHVNQLLADFASLSIKKQKID